MTTNNNQWIGTTIIEEDYQLIVRRLHDPGMFLRVHVSKYDVYAANWTEEHFPPKIDACLTQLGSTSGGFITYDEMIRLISENVVEVCMRGKNDAIRTNEEFLARHALNELLATNGRTEIIWFWIPPKKKGLRK